MEPAICNGGTLPPGPMPLLASSRPGLARRSRPARGRAPGRDRDRAVWLGLCGFAAGIAAGIAFGRGNKIPKRMAPVRWRHLFRRRPLTAGLLAGLVAGRYPAAGLVFGDTGAAPTGKGRLGAAWVGLVPGLWPGLGPGSSPECPGQELTTPALLVRSPHGAAIERSGSWPGSWSGLGSGSCSGSCSGSRAGTSVDRAGSALGLAVGLGGRASGLARVSPVVVILPRVRTARCV